MILPRVGAECFLKNKVSQNQRFTPIGRMLEYFRTLAHTGRKVQDYITHVWRGRGTLVSGEHALPKNSWGLRGKYDAICNDNGKLVLVEIKSAGQQLYEWYKSAGRALPAHRVQLLTYYLVMREYYPAIDTQLLYVNRKTRRAFALDITPTDEELCVLIEKIETLSALLRRGAMPPAAAAVEPDLMTGAPTLSMTALTCRYHVLCLEDDNWYEKAHQQLLCPPAKIANLQSPVSHL